MIKQEDILKIFYEEIVPVASSTGDLKIDGINYNLSFNTKILNNKINGINSDLPMLMISDVDNFNNKLALYINEAIKVFDDRRFEYAKEMFCGSKKEDQVKFLMMVLFSNAREEDFRNPVSYLDMELDFLKDCNLVDKYYDYTKIASVEELDSDIEICFQRQNPNLETPYVFSSRLVKKTDDKREYFDLPNISYGVSDDTAYIYTIQGKKKNIEDKFSKKINRALYKINSGVEQTDEYLEYKNNEKKGFYPENIIDVTHSSVVALTIFLAVLNNEKYKELTVVDYLPIRYMSKTKTLTNKYLRKTDSKDFSSIEQSVEQEQDYNQNNITNKFIRTFERVNYHLDNMDVVAYPLELDNSMHIKLHDANSREDNLVNKIYNAVSNNEKESRKV